MEFSHFDSQGNAVMVDVSPKQVTSRQALACGKIRVNQDIIDKIENNSMSKGDVLSVARIAGIMGV